MRAVALGLLGAGPPPPIALRTLAGAEVRITHDPGEPDVVLHFWATLVPRVCGRAAEPRPRSARVRSRARARARGERRRGAGARDARISQRTRSRCPCCSIPAAGHGDRRRFVRPALEFVLDGAGRDHERRAHEHRTLERAPRGPRLHARETVSFARCDPHRRSRAPAPAAAGSQPQSRRSAVRARDPTRRRGAARDGSPARRTLRFRRSGVSRAAARAPRGVRARGRPHSDRSLHRAQPGRAAARDTPARRGARCASSRRSSPRR